MRTRATAVLGGILLLLSVLATVTPAQATAGYTTLCRGYTTCANAGMGNGGYSSHNQTMYWRMYSGHNCVNYAAYRMVASGMPNVRPWSGGGNATYWGTSNPSITDQTPRVGAVAWWRANSSPAGSAGHVGYVEQVVSPSEIIVSMDWWGGDFTWARIIKGGGSWPSGFIHFNDRKMASTAAPAVSGTAQVGATLTSSAATFTPAPDVVTYQWRANGVAIAGATGQSLAARARPAGQADHRPGDRHQGGVPDRGRDVDADRRGGRGHAHQHRRPGDLGPDPRRRHAERHGRHLDPGGRLGHLPVARRRRRPRRRHRPEPAAPLRAAGPADHGRWRPPSSPATRPPPPRPPPPRPSTPTC